MIDDSSWYGTSGTASLARMREAIELVQAADQQVLAEPPPPHLTGRLAEVFAAAALALPAADWAAEVITAPIRVAALG